MGLKRGADPLFEQGWQEGLRCVVVNGRNERKMIPEDAYRRHLEDLLCTRCSVVLRT